MTRRFRLFISWRFAANSGLSAGPAIAIPPLKKTRASASRAINAGNGIMDRIEFILSSVYL